jgi:hypothetical protein
MNTTPTAAPALCARCGHVHGKYVVAFLGLRVQECKTCACGAADYVPAPAPGSDAAILAGIEALGVSGDPLYVGPLCGAWLGSPDPEGCEHETCYRLAYRDAPPHECAVEADHDDPISIEYGMYLATCPICEAWEAASERAAVRRNLEGLSR